MKANRDRRSGKQRKGRVKPRHFGWTALGGGRLETLENRTLLSGDPIASWHNPRNRYDVNGDLSVTPLDALVLINDLNSTGTRSLTPGLGPVAQGYLGPNHSGGMYLDVSGDGVVGPLDALQIINVLNQANGEDLIRVRLQTTDAAGNPISSVPAGTDFYLEARVQDIRPDGDNQGVFAAYLDVNYPAGAVVLDPPVQFGPSYTNVTSQNTTPPGEIDDTGATSNTLSPLGPDERLLWRIPVRATTAGATLDFTPNPLDVDDNPGHQFLLYGSNIPVPADEVDFSPVSVLVTPGVNTATVSINDVTVTEGNAGTTNAVFTVTVSDTTQPATVVFQTANGTALSGSDYNAATATLTFTQGGPTTRTVTVAVRGDTVVESDEQFFVNLVDPLNLTLADGQGTGTIIDNDATGPRLSISDVTVTEPDGGQVNAIFTVTLLSGVNGQQVTVGYSTADGSATAGQDYLSRSGVLTFAAPANTTQVVTVPVLGDTIFEANETFLVNLSSAVNATIVDSSGIGTITNNDTAPTISVNDVTVTEGDVFPQNVVFNVTLSAASGQQTTVAFATADGTAVAPGDYTAANGTITFAAGTTSVPVTIQVLGDTVDEINETFSLILSNANGATIGDGVGTGTIIDNEDSPILSTSNASVIEGDAQNVNAIFTISLSTPSANEVTVAYATENVEATAGLDYTAQIGTATIAAGSTSTTITVPVLGDTIDEVNETFRVNFGNPVNATLGAGEETAVGTIVDNEGAPSLTVTDVSVNEGNSGTVEAVFTVLLAPTSGQQVTVNYQTANGTATSPDDYASTSGVLTFAPGVNSQTVTVTVNGDVILEGLETFQLNLSNAVNAGISDGTGVASIVDDDGAPALSVSDASVIESTGTPVNMVFTVSLVPATSQTVRVNYVTTNGSAINNVDFIQQSGTLTFSPGVTQQLVTVSIVGDSATEGTETFFLNLTNPFPADVQLADPQGIGTIQDDEVPVTISIDDVTVNEGQLGGTTAVFTVSLSGGTATSITVGFATADGTASAGSDYTPQTGILTFNPGETTKLVTVPVLGDSVDEGNETFFVNLSSVVGATIADAQGIGTITDDEGLSVSNVTVVEGDVGEIVNAVFTIDLTSTITSPITVQYSTGDGDALEGLDYAAQSGTLTFNPGTTRQFVTVPVVGDSIIEGSESFFLNLSGAVGADVVDAQGIATILDNDSVIPAQVRIRLAVTDLTDNPVSVLNNGDQFFLIAYVDDLRNVDEGVLAAYLDVFYNSAVVAPTGPIVYGPNYPNIKSGDTSVPGLIDEVGAFDGLIPLGPAEQELFRIPMQAINNGLALFDADPADIQPDHAVLVYNSNEPVPPNEILYEDATVSIGENFFAIDDVTVTEGDNGTTNAVFTVTRTLPNANSATVVFNTVAGSATAGTDFLPQSGTLTFGPNDGTPQTITVQVVGDTLNEANENFFVQLSDASGASIGDSSGTGTINDDDAAPTVSISDASATEGGNAVFTVTLSGTSAQTITMTFTTTAPENGTPATAGADFTPTSGTLTFAAGETQKTITVVTLSDLVDPEANETFGVALSLSPIAQIVDGQGLGTIQNVTLSQISGFVYVDINSNGVRDAGESGIQGVQVIATRTDGGSLTQTTTTAADGSYRFLALPAGTYSIREVQPGFFFDGIDTIGTPPSGTVGNDIFTGVLLDEGDVYQNYNFGERGLRPEVALPFINRRAFFASAITTGIWGPGASTENMDLRNGDHFVSFDGGWLGARNIVALFDSNLGTVNLTLYEIRNNQLVQVATSTPDTNRAEITYVGNGTSTYILKISGSNFDVDLRVFETLSVNNVTVTEGSSGTTNAVFTVSLTGPVNQQTTVQYTTAMGTASPIALPGSPADFTQLSGILTFAAGTTTQTVTVPINGDTVDESNETLFLNLSLPSGVSIYDGQGALTIVDDDMTPTLTISDVSITEGDTGFVNAVFTLTLSAVSGQGATVRYITSDGNATSPADYTAVNGVATFAPGALTQLVTVQVNGDTINELNETFTLNLTNPTNLLLSDTQGLATIIDTDPARTLIISDITVQEGNGGTTNAVFNVGLSQVSSQTITVVYSTANGSAQAGSDYVATSGTLTFAPGETLKQVTVAVNGDTQNEGDETFFVNLSNAINSTLVDAQGQATILANDPIVALSVSDTSMIEGSGTLGNMVFVVDMTVPSTQTVTVRYATSNGTAAGGIDYTIRSGTLTFAPGQTSQTVQVPVIGDNVDENNETIVLTLSSPTGGAILNDATGIGTIIDDDGPITPQPMIAPAASTGGSSTGSAAASNLSSIGSAGSSSLSGRWAYTASALSGDQGSLASPQAGSVDAALDDDDWLQDLRF